MNNDVYLLYIILAIVSMTLGMVVAISLFRR